MLEIIDDNDEFIILIGSYARNTYNQYSDIDVVRLNTIKKIHKTTNFDKKKISYIDYDCSSFKKLYKNGSLFLYHIFTEGILLEGDKNKWEFIKNRFKLSNDFKDEIIEYEVVLRYLCEYKDYENAYLAYLSNMFKLLKNLAIFHLAQEKIYLFDKAKVLEKYYNISKNDCTLLITSNNCFERNIKITTKMKLKLQNFALEFKRKYNICKGLK